MVRVALGFVIVIIIFFTIKAFSLSYLGAMQTPEAGADSTSTVPLQTTVPVQPTGSTQQVPVQQQVQPTCLCVIVSLFLITICYLSQFNN